MGGDDPNPTEVLETPTAQAPDDDAALEGFEGLVIPIVRGDEEDPEVKSIIPQSVRRSEIQFILERAIAVFRQNFSLD